MKFLFHLITRVLNAAAFILMVTAIIEYVPKSIRRLNHRLAERRKLRDRGRACEAPLPEALASPADPDAEFPPYQP
jgi:hypothetical protein